MNYSHGPQQPGHPQGYGPPPGAWQAPPPGYGPSLSHPAPPEPKRGGRGGLTALVLVLLLGAGALAFTGFVEPGFLQDDERPAQSAKPDVTPAAEAFAGDFFDKIHAGDKPAAKASFCPYARTFHRMVDNAVTGKGRFTLVPKKAPKYGAPDFAYSGKFTGKVAGQSITDGSINLSSRDHGKTWCVETFRFDEPTPDPAQVTAALEQILAHVGKGDRGVTKWVCRSGKVRVKDLAPAVKRRAKLKLDRDVHARPVNGGVVKETTFLVGSMAGKKVVGDLVIVSADGGKSWCIATFLLVQP